MTPSPRLRALAPTIRRLARAGWSVVAIARYLGFARAEVAELLSGPATAPVGPRLIAGRLAVQIRRRIADGESAESIARAHGLAEPDVQDYVDRLTPRRGLKGTRARPRTHRDQSTPAQSPLSPERLARIQPHPRQRSPAVLNRARSAREQAAVERAWKGAKGVPDESLAERLEQPPESSSSCHDDDRCHDTAGGAATTIGPIEWDGPESPYATSLIDGARLADDHGDAIEPPPPPATSASRSTPRPRRWRKPRRRDDARHRDDD